MQYLLSKEEMEELAPKLKLVERDNALKVARKEILKLSGYGCFHDMDGPGYHGCDDCPLSEFQEGEYRPIMALICTEQKDYSQ